MIALFPGQGSQHVGMGKSLYENFSLVRQLYEEASDAIRKDLKSLCFEGPDADLILTENTQPCLVLNSVAAFRVAAAEVGFTAKMAAGHSLGEYSALVALEALPFASAIRWVHERGKAMQAAVPSGTGGMTAIMGLEDSLVETLCESAQSQTQETVSPANFNAPGQVVIAGSTHGLEKAKSLLASDSRFSGGKGIPLAVSAPFHCALMAPARERMKSLFLDAQSFETPKRPRCEYFPNRTARRNLDPELIFEFLIEQIDHPVLWRQTIEKILEQNNSAQPGVRAIEFGPGKVLQGLCKRIAKPLGKTFETFSFGEKEQISELALFLKKTGTPS